MLAPNGSTAQIKLAAQFFSTNYFQKWAGEIAPIWGKKYGVACVAAYSKNQLLQHPSSCSIYGRAANDAFDPKNDITSQQPNHAVVSIN